MEGRENAHRLDNEHKYQYIKIGEINCNAKIIEEYPYYAQDIRYSGPLTYELNSFLRAGPNSSWL
jgi:hypothetical protein